VDPANIENVGRSPNTKTPKIRRKIMREYLKGMIADSSPMRRAFISNK
jgi:hypothetical protein